MCRECLIACAAALLCAVQFRDRLREQQCGIVGQAADGEALLSSIGAPESVEHALQMNGWRVVRGLCGRGSPHGNALCRIEEPSDVTAALCWTGGMQECRIPRTDIPEKCRPRIRCVGMCALGENACGTQQCRTFDPLTQIFHSLISFHYYLIL